MIHFDEQLIQDYLADCREHLAAMETELFAMRMSKAADHDERLHRIFRAAHGIGGPAPYFDLVKFRDLAFQIENLVAHLGSRNLAPGPEEVRVLLAGTDRLRELMQSPDTSNQADTAAVMADLRRSLADHPMVSDLAGNDVCRHSRPDSGRLKILLVEDDFACRLLLQTFLARYGDCHIAVNGKEAVDAFRIAMDQDERYDLICMDIMMPEMDGREAVRQVRALEETRGIQSTFGAKIFMTTTVQQVREVFLCFKELCDAYLMKPIDLQQLLGQMQYFHLLA